MQNAGPYLKLAAALGLVGMTIALLGIAAAVLAPEVGPSVLKDSITLLVIGGLMVVPYKVDLSANRRYQVTFVVVAVVAVAAAMML
jgi:hypothetical protein